MKRSARALTLPELLIGIAITALVGLSVSTVASVLSGTYCRSEEFHRFVQSARIATLNIQSQVRKAHLITEVSPERMMIWREPAGGDGQINPSELVLILYYPNEDEIKQYQVVLPEWMSPEVRLLEDAPVELADLVAQPAFWADVVRLNSYSQCRVLASGITDFSLSGSAPAPMTRLVTSHVTAGQGVRAVHLRGSAAARADHPSGS